MRFLDEEGFEKARRISAEGIKNFIESEMRRYAIEALERAKSYPGGDDPETHSENGFRTCMNMTNEKIDAEIAKLGVK